MNYIDTVAAIAAVNIIVHLLKYAAPGLSGRYTQLVVLILSIAAAFGTVPITQPEVLIANIGIISAGAVALDQATKKAV